MDAMTDRPLSPRYAVKAIAGAVTAILTVLMAARAAGGPLDFSLEASGWTFSAGSIVSVKVGGPQGVILGFATMSATVGVLRADFSRRGAFRLRTLDGSRVAEFDVPPERLKALGVKSGDPVEVHRAPAGWRLTAHGQDLAYVVDESGTSLLTSTRR